MIAGTDRRSFLLRAVAWVGCCLSGAVLAPAAKAALVDVPGTLEGKHLVHVAATYADGRTIEFFLGEGTAINLECEAIEKTQPGDTFRSYRQGRKFLILEGEILQEKVA